MTSLEIRLDGKHARYFDNPFVESINTPQVGEAISQHVTPDWLATAITRLVDRIIAHPIEEDELYEGEKSPPIENRGTNDSLVVSGAIHGRCRDKLRPTPIGPTRRKYGEQVHQLLQSGDGISGR